MTLAIRQFPQERDRDANESAVRRWRAANQPHENGSGVPCSVVPPVAAIGAPGEQKHLPDWFIHHGSKERRPRAFVGVL
jgi:hypothetical protein